MPSRYYRFEGTKVVELGVSDSSAEALSPAVHGDEMQPLRHPVTGKMYTSVAKYVRDTKRMGYEIMGTEKHGPQILPDRIKPDQIIEACHKAEAIQADPARLRAYYNKNDILREKLERQQVINGHRR